MTILVTFFDKKSQSLFVDYGYNVETGEIVIIPQVPICYVDHKFDSEIGEYILK